MSDCSIYVGLLDEGVDVWRPVRATHVAGSVYRIAEQSYDRETETWQFVPGTLVVCEQRDTDEGSVLAATRFADSGNAEGESLYRPEG